MAMGEPRRATPFSTVFAYHRGDSLDRRYIEDFLWKHAGDVRGRLPWVCPIDREGDRGAYGDASLAAAAR